MAYGLKACSCNPLRKTMCTSFEIRLHTENFSTWTKHALSAHLKEILKRKEFKDGKFMSFNISESYSLLPRALTPFLWKHSLCQFLEKTN